MNLTILCLIGLSVVPGILITKFIINMRKRQINAEESTQHLKEEFEAKLRVEERKRRDFEEKIFKVEKERNRLEDALRRLVVYQEAFGKAGKIKQERYEAERKQFEEKLSQSEEERKNLASELQMALQDSRRIQEEERSKLQEAEQRLQAEKDRWDRTQKEMAATLDVQKRELEEQLHKITEERNCLKETLREMVKDVEELRQKHARQGQLWRSEIEKRDKTQKEMIETFDSQRRDFEDKLLKADGKVELLEGELKEEREGRRQILDEQERSRAEEEKQTEAQKQLIVQLDAECQELKERLSEIEGNRNSLEEKLRQAMEEVQSKVEAEKFKQLEAQSKQLEEMLLKSEKKRERLIAKLKKIKPINRGGRPRDLLGKTEAKGTIEKEQKKEQEKWSLKPEIICWKEGWTWIIGIELPEGLESPSVSQDGIPLDCDIGNGNRYSLKQMQSGVEITLGGTKESISLLRPERNYFTFKMRNNWKDPGRLVRYSTTGYYLIIAPKDWERDEEISGTATIAPESTQFPEFKAYFFYVEKTGINTIGLIASDGKRVRVDSKGPRFKLVGNEINDASENRGPLFAEKPPLIQTLDETKGWSDVGLIVVGEEGGGKNRWHDSFVPNLNMREQTTLDELISGRSGWYFLRIYDENDDLMESMDFRFLKNLRDIQIEGCASCLPGPTGHENILVKFLYYPDCMVALKDEDKQHLLDIHWENDQTSVNVPPNPDCDKTNWILNDGGVEIEVNIIVERIWWSLGTLEAVPDIWTDRPTPLSRNEFTAITNNTLWVRFPHPRFVRKIGVGFDRAKSRFYQVEVEKKEVPIPLRDFCDCEEIRNPMEECFFQIFIDSLNGSLSAPVLSVITSFGCRHCQFMTNSEQEILSHIRVHLNDLIPHLSYEELWRRSKLVLPYKIYKCLYCGFYVKVGNPDNPTSEICSHIERLCPNALRLHGSPEIYFTIVDDINEIRSEVIHDLPYVYQCRICNKKFYANDRKSMLEHLKVIHKNELFRCL